MKTVAFAVAMAIASLSTARAQTSDFPFQVTEIRRSDKAFCEIVVQSSGKDTAVDGYALVVGINAPHATKRMREGVIKDAAAKGAELCTVTSGKTYQGASGSKAVWELIGLRDKPEGTCLVELPGDVAFKKPVRVKAQLVALAGGTWIEKSKALEKMIKP